LIIEVEYYYTSIANMSTFISIPTPILPIPNMHYNSWIYTLFIVLLISFIYIASVNIPPFISDNVRNIISSARWNSTLPISSSQNFDLSIRYLLNVPSPIQRAGGNIQIPFFYILIQNKIFILYIKKNSKGI